MEELEADQAAADREEGFVDVGTALVADAQAAVLVQPGDRAFDGPALASEAGAVRALRPCDLRLDAASAEFVAAASRVVGTVGEQLVGRRRGRVTADRGYGHDKYWRELRDRRIKPESPAARPGTARVWAALAGSSSAP